MAALLALFTFACFISLDYLLTRRAARRSAAAQAPPVPAAAPALGLQPIGDPVFVAGYELPGDYHYHRGHTWVRVLGPDTVVVGLDDFARRLLGKAKGLQLPAVGAWLRQGVAALRVDNNGRSAELLAPVEGRVLEVNADVRRRPGLATEDPYRHGWLIKLQSADLAANLRNLMTGGLARRWIEDCREQLELRLMAISGTVVQDGGEPAHDFAEHLDDEEWAGIVETFLMTGTGKPGALDASRFVAASGQGGER